MLAYGSGLAGCAQMSSAPRFAAFGQLVQPFDALAAAWFGPVMVRRAGLGLPIEGFDAQIAAICRARGAVLATRNIKDFLETGVEVINPWSTR